MKNYINQVQVDGVRYDLVPNGNYITTDEALSYIHSQVNSKLRYSLNDLTKLVVKYGLGGQNTPPPYDATAQDPGSAWHDADYSFPNTGYIWRIESQWESSDGETFSLKTNWSTPMRLTGDAGRQGPSGNAGVDGNTTEFIYTRTETVDTPLTPETTQVNDWHGASRGVIWTDRPQGVNSILQCEWVSQRTKKNGVWGDFSTPTLWAKWGDVGQDGDGIQYVYKLTQTNTAPPRVVNLSDSTFNEEGELIPIGWTDNPTGISETYPYEWVMTRKYNESTLYTAPFSSPALWAKWGEDGQSSSPVTFQITNNNIHLDAATPASTLTNSDVSTSILSVKYGNELIPYGKSGTRYWYVDEVVFYGDTEVHSALQYSLNGTTMKFTYKSGTTKFDVSEMAYGTYTFHINWVYGKESGTLHDQINVVVRNITNGVNYSLMAYPGSILLNSDQKTTATTYINFTATKIENGKTNAVTIGSDSFVLTNLSSIGRISNGTLTIPSGTTINAPITVALSLSQEDAENGVYLDSEVVELSVKGESGLDADVYSVSLDNDNISVSKGLTNSELRQISTTTVYVYKNSSLISDFTISAPDCYAISGNTLYLTEIPDATTVYPITVKVNDTEYVKTQSVTLTSDSYRLSVSPQTVLYQNNAFISNSIISLNLEIYKNGWQEYTGDVEYHINNRVASSSTVDLSALFTIQDTYRVEAYVNNELVDWEEITAVPVPTNGTNGSSGAFKSIAFLRTNDEISATVPTGGTYTNPLPTGWSDGVPAGDEILWATSCIFYADGTKTAWSSPAQMTDTETYDVEFSAIDPEPGNPTDNPEYWHDPSEDIDFTGMIWRAERTITNGVPSLWTIIRIKGEKGDPGQSSGYSLSVYMKNDNIDLDDETSKAALDNTKITTSTFYVQKQHTDLMYGTSGDEYFYLSDLYLTGDSIITSALDVVNLNNGSVKLVYKDGVTQFTMPENAIAYATVNVKINYKYIDTDLTTVTGDFSRQINVQVRNISTGGTNYELFVTPGSLQVTSDYKVYTTDNSDYAVFSLSGSKITGEGGESSIDLTSSEYTVSASAGTIVNKNTLRVPVNIVQKSPISIKLTRAGEETILAQENIELSVSGTSGSFTSIIFKRAVSQPDTPTGGTYNNPIPDGWSDGIPSADNRMPLYASSRTFYYNDSVETEWSEPRLMADTTTYDVEFSDSDAMPLEPSEDTVARPAQGWYDPSTSNIDFTKMKWRAERVNNNGVWGKWVITKILGEDGQDGESITITSVQNKYIISAAISTQPHDSLFDLASDTIGTVSLGDYIWSRTVVTYSDGTQSKTYDVSRIGEDGAAGTNGANGTIMHIAYATSNIGENFSTTHFEGATYIGVCVTNTEIDPQISDLATGAPYDWSRLKGDKGEDGQDAYSLNISCNPATEIVQVLRNGSVSGTALQYYVDVNGDRPDSVEITGFEIAGVNQYDSSHTVSYQNYGAVVTVAWPDACIEGESKATASFKVTYGHQQFIKIVTTPIKFIKLYSGQDAVNVDLTNDVICWSCDENGLTLGSYTATSTPLVYLGTEQIPVSSVSINNESLQTGVPKTYSNITITYTTQKQLTITCPSNTQLNTETVLPLTITGQNGSSATINLRIIALREGKDAIQYNLSTSDNAVVLHQDGTYSPTSVSCNRTKQIGATISDTTEGVLQYQKDNNSAWITYSGAISTSGLTDHITFRWQLNGQTIDEEIVRVVKDGTNGKEGSSAVQANLSNSVICWSCDDDYKTLTAYSETSTPLLYYGKHKITPTVTIGAVPTGVTVKVTGTTLVISTTKGTDLSAKNYIVPLTLTGTYENETYTADTELRITAVKSGADALSYALTVSSSTISEKSDGTKIPTKLTCSARKRVGRGIATIDSDATIQYQIDEGAWYNYSGEISTAVISSQITFKYTTLINGVSEEVDSETVYVVTDGVSPSVYEILPSTSTIKKYANGTCYPSTISASVNKFDGSNISLYNYTSGSLTYSIDGAASQPYTSAINTFSITKQIVFRLSVDGNEVDIKTIPVLQDGGFVKADLSDDTKVWGVDSDNKLLITHTNDSTQLRLYVGSESVDITKVQIGTQTVTTTETTISNIKFKRNGSKSLYISATQNTVIADSNDFEVTLTGTYNGSEVSGVCSLKINAVHDGAAGYSLVPNNKVIKLTDGTYSPTRIAFTASKLSSSGQYTQLTDPTIKYYIDEATSGTTYLGPISLATDKPTKYLTAELYINGIIVDKESIPVVSDGKDGLDGSNGKDGTNGESAVLAKLSNSNLNWACDYDGHALAAYSNEITAQLYYGVKSCAITNVARISEIPTGIAISITGNTIKVSRASDIAFDSRYSITFNITGTCEGQTHSSQTVLDIICTRAGKDGENGKNGSFKSYVFTRATSQPATPTGGSYANPVPTQSIWSDTTPNGTDPVWMSSAFFQSDTSSATWSTPSKIADTVDLDYAFLDQDATLSYIQSHSPGNGSSTTQYENGWADSSTENTYWMALRKWQNGNWGSWSFTKIKGEDGKDGINGKDGADGVQGDFKSQVFKRSLTAPTKPTGGSYKSPIPTGWSDGIPSDSDYPVWMSVATFSVTTTSPAWSSPVQITNTADIRYRFCDLETLPESSNPATDTASWKETATDNTYWMAVQKQSNGVWGTWSYARIKGEKGDSAESVITLDSSNDFMCWTCDKNNKTTTGYIEYTDIRMYYGLQEVKIENLTVSGYSTGLDITKATLGKGYRLTILAASGVKLPTTQSITITAEATINGVAKIAQCTVTITTVQNGENGLAAVQYQLQTSASVIRLTQAGTYSPSFINCYARKVVGNNDPVDDTNSILEYKYGELSWTTVENNRVDIIAGIESIQLRQRIGTTVVDMETIPIIEDGADGEDGIDGESAIDLRLSPQIILLHSTTDGTLTGNVTSAKRTTVYIFKYEGSIVSEFAKGTTIKSDGSTNSFASNVVCSMHGDYATITFTWDTSFEARYSEYYFKITEGSTVYDITVPVTVTKDGLAGAFTSIVFCRAAKKPATPTTGSYLLPIPSGWYDSIPEELNGWPVWATQRTFYTDNANTTWSEPRLMLDTATLDVEFAMSADDGGMPDGPDATNRHGGSGEQVWFDPTLDYTQDFTKFEWRAERECLNGTWSDWTITRIKGEKGEEGTAVVVQASPTTAQVIINDLQEINAQQVSFYVYENENKAEANLSITYKGANSNNLVFDIESTMYGAKVTFTQKTAANQMGEGEIEATLVGIDGGWTRQLIIPVTFIQEPPLSISLAAGVSEIKVVSGNSRRFANVIPLTLRVGEIFESINKGSIFISCAGLAVTNYTINDNLIRLSLTPNHISAIQQAQLPQLQIDYTYTKSNRYGYATLTLPITLVEYSNCFNLVGYAQGMNTDERDQISSSIPYLSDGDDEQAYINTETAASMGYTQFDAFACAADEHVYMLVYSTITGQESVLQWVDLGRRPDLFTKRVVTSVSSLDPNPSDITFSAQLLINGEWKNIGYYMVIEDSFGNSDYDITDTPCQVSEYDFSIDTYPRYLNIYTTFDVGTNPRNAAINQKVTLTRSTRITLTSPVQVVQTGHTYNIPFTIWQGDRPVDFNSKYVKASIKALKNNGALSVINGAAVKAATSSQITTFQGAKPGYLYLPLKLSTTLQVDQAIGDPEEFCFVVVEIQLQSGESNSNPEYYPSAYLYFQVG